MCRWLCGVLMPSDGAGEGLSDHRSLPAALIVIRQQKAYSNRLTRIELFFSKVIYCNVVSAPDEYATWKIHCGNRVDHVPHVGNRAKVPKKPKSRSGNIAIAQECVIKARRPRLVASVTERLTYNSDSTVCRWQ